MNELRKMSQTEYDRIMNAILRALQTQRRFVTVIRETSLDNGRVAYSVKVRGFGYCVTMDGIKVVEIAREVLAV